MKHELIAQLKAWHGQNKQSDLQGRYINYNMIRPLLAALPVAFKVEPAGLSFENRLIYTVQIGNGSKKVLLWSQMHGNESTGTKAIFDLFEFFLAPGNHKAFVQHLLTECNFLFIPMLNPDGAEIYTRKNAQEIDLNRDAVDLKAPESKILNKLLYEFKPDFCFNLHDQRTIYSVGKAKLPASLSFLAPSEDQERSLTEGRKVSMSVISAIFNDLKNHLPGQIGRYTDEFYPNATGDNFQKAGFYTILIEAGHIKGDYTREKVRCYNFLALISGFAFIAQNKQDKNFETYNSIPNIEKHYLDAIYTNVLFKGSQSPKDLGIRYKELLINEHIEFVPEIAKIDDLNLYQSDLRIDKTGETYNTEAQFLKLIKK